MQAASRSLSCLLAIASVSASVSAHAVEPSAPVAAPSGSALTPLTGTVGAGPGATAGAGAGSDTSAVAKPPPSDDDWAPLLTDGERVRAQELIAAMQKNPRGPYVGISWYCNDGTEQLPHLNGCVEHGGGKMYGVLGLDAARLAKLGVHVGTVLAALSPADLLAGGTYRLEALVIERYLERALGGWALAAAKTYRGFRQDEDEEKAARELLVALAGQRPLLEPERALFMRLMRALPYGRGGDALADQIRTLAATLGDADQAFASLRFKIHAAPEPADVASVEAYAAQASGENAPVAAALAAAMRSYYEPTSRVARLQAVRGWLPKSEVRSAIDAFVATPATETDALLQRGLAVIEAAAVIVWPTDDPKRSERNLLALHSMGLVEELWLPTAAALATRPTTRAALLGDAELLVRAAWRVGLLSQRERDAAQGDLGHMRSGKVDEYVRAAARLGRVLEWSRARVADELGLALRRYQAVEPRAAAIVDDVLRSGVMLPLAAVLDRVAADAARLRGGGHRLVGLTAENVVLRGENPGLAIGPLRIIKPEGALSELKREDIALLYDLPPDLPPVAGVIVVGSIGSLSHVALLARNLAIPVAAIGASLARTLDAFEGSPIVLGVTQGRRVALGPAEALSAVERGDLQAEQTKDASAAHFTIDAAKLDLATARIMPLAEISELHAGVRVGPKAAELGRLTRLFPARVSPAAVIPFGVFLRHVDAPAPDGTASPLAKLRAAYAKLAAPLADASLRDAAEIEMLAALAAFREAIAHRAFPKGFETEVTQALARLGAPGTFGVFVRSDTNVEDLKDFTGAGLNLTVSNRVGTREVLQAIREVWASPFTERSFRWRQRLLTNPEQVYPSVLLHRTVPSEISGVLVTTDIDGEVADAVTVSANEGVSAVVDGGVPETLVLEPDGAVRLLSSARSPVQRRIPKPPKQGVDLVAARGLDPLLSARQVDELRRLAAEVRAKVPAKSPGLPWDVEFGLLGNKAFLMQIRPLKISRAPSAHPFLQAIDAQAATSPITIDLNETLR